jgi:hypothetical protein
MLTILITGHVLIENFGGEKYDRLLWVFTPAFMFSRRFITVISSSVILMLDIVANRPIWENLNRQILEKVLSYHINILLPDV